MVNSNDIKTDIISLLSRIDDPDKLKQIYEDVKELESRSASKVEEENLSYIHAVTDLSSGLTYQQILKEQGYQPIAYREFRDLADQVEWEHSLDELLIALD